MQHVVILGAGFGGLELATLLSEAVPDLARVTLIDKSDSFMFGYSKLDVMFGRRHRSRGAPALPRARQAAVEFRQETIESIDPAHAPRRDLGRHLRRRHPRGRARCRPRSRGDARSRGGRQRVLHRGRGDPPPRDPPDVRRGPRGHQRARAVLQVPGRAVRGGDDVARPPRASAASATRRRSAC